MKKMVWIGLLGGMTGSVFAQSANQAVSPAEGGQSSAAVSKAQAPMAVCPDISQIKKDPVHANWTATTPSGFWKSYHMSFATNLDHFMGAQWVGANLGQVTCVYSSSQQFMLQGQLDIQKTIPVLLIYHALAHEPQGLNWKRTSHGVYNCASQKQEDCTFAINIEAKPGNIFDEAESFKSRESSASSPLNSD